MLDATAIREAARSAASDMVGFKIADTETLVSSGLIDSLSVVKLIASLEQKLNVTLPPDNLQPEDFDDLDLIVETVLRVAKPK
jgi:acyl carrier protein